MYVFRNSPNLPRERVGWRLLLLLNSKRLDKFSLVLRMFVLLRRSDFLLLGPRDIASCANTIIRSRVRPKGLSPSKYMAHWTRVAL